MRGLIPKNTSRGFPNPGKVGGEGIGNVLAARRFDFSAISLLMNSLILSRNFSVESLSISLTNDVGSQVRVNFHPLWFEMQLSSSQFLIGRTEILELSDEISKGTSTSIEPRESS